jgi:hypothetical protein
MDTAEKMQRNEEGSVAQDEMGPNALSSRSPMRCDGAMLAMRRSGGLGNRRS